MNAAQLRICVQRTGAVQCSAVQAVQVNVQVAECQEARRRYLPQALHCPLPTALSYRQKQDQMQLL